jgi:predicted component of type VI protein secretion system
LSHHSTGVPRLLWRDAQGIEGSLDLANAEIRVGRAMECAIRTDDAMVSRHHARIFWGGGGYVLEDLSSANGVYFQEQRVQNHLFKHGDAVRCGSLWLRFVDSGAAAAPPPSGPTPMMQHPGIGPVAAGGQTGHVAAVSPQIAQMVKDANAGTARPADATAPPPMHASGLGALVEGGEADAEIRVLRRRIEQLQTELRVYRANKVGHDGARRMEELEGEVSRLEVERDNLKNRGAAAATAPDNAKLKQALELAATTAETAASLNDVLSSLRIEVMAAEGALDQYAQALPRASYDLIRQSLRDAAGHCDEARDILRKLRDTAG